MENQERRQAEQQVKDSIENDELARQRLRLWLQLLKAVRDVEGGLRERLRVEYKTTLPRFDVLATLHANPDGMRMSQLSRHLVVSNGNVTSIVERLLKEGLVERQILASDRRASLVRINESGKILMDEMAAEHLGWINEAFSTVSETDVARSISVMLDVRQKNSQNG